MASTQSIFPKGEMLRRAVLWISQNKAYDLAMIEEASERFNLSPLDEEFLIRHFLHADAPETKQQKP